MENFLKTILFVIIFLFTAGAQTFQNLNIIPKEDSVIVTYDIFGGRDFDSFKIDFIVSEDGGRTFNLIPKRVFGDYGYGQTKGINKMMIWEPLKDSIELAGENFVFKLMAEILGTSKEIEFVKIDGGSFYMGDNYEEGQTDEKNVHLVNLNDFEISKFEITNYQFASFLKEYGDNFVSNGEFKGELMLNESERGLRFYEGVWQPQSGYEYHPVVGVTWYGANEFCRYYNYRLPTEAEWEYAAREGGKKLRYGSGKNNASSMEINFDASFDVKYEYALLGEKKGKSVGVGSYPPNLKGIFEMSGNVWEWCQDWYASNFYFHSKTDNPTGPWFGRYKVIRGGSFNNNAFDVRTTDRGFYIPYNSTNDIGFRVVKSLTD